MMVSVCVSHKDQFLHPDHNPAADFSFFNSFTSQIYSVIHVLLFIYLLKFPSPTYNNVSLVC